MSTTSQQPGGSHEPLLDGLVEEVTLREQVRARYAGLAELAAAGATCGCGQPVDCGCGADCCTGVDENQPGVAAELYPAADRAALPETAVLASLGCGNPTAVAELRPGEVVLDLGSGGGIDVLLSAKRVGPTGKAYGLDMTEEMLALARRNALEAGATNVEWLKGHIEAIPLPAATVDVVISNCVVNLSVDKAATFAEALRVLKPGGRLGVSDVVAEDHLTPEQRAERGSYVGCIAGALSKAEYEAGLAAAGFAGVSVTFSHQLGDGIHSAIVKATKPADAEPAVAATTPASRAAPADCLPARLLLSVEPPGSERPSGVALLRNEGGSAQGAPGRAAAGGAGGRAAARVRGDGGPARRQRRPRRPANRHGLPRAASARASRAGPKPLVDRGRPPPAQL